MSYMSTAEMVQSNSLRQRLVVAAAKQGLPSPDLWVNARLWEIATSPGWDDAWESAKASATLDHNPDTGARPGAITDTMIHDVIAAIITAEAPA